MPQGLVPKVAILGSIYQQDKGRKVDEDANLGSPNETTATLSAVSMKTIEGDH
jgi:hypothetical protein